MYLMKSKMPYLPSRNRTSENVVDVSYSKEEISH